MLLGAGPGHSQCEMSYYLVGLLAKPEATSIVYTSRAPDVLGREWGNRASQPSLAKGQGEQCGSSWSTALSGLALVSLLKPQRDAFPLPCHIRESCLSVISSQMRTTVQGVVGKKKRETRTRWKREQEEGAGRHRGGKRGCKKRREPAWLLS